MKVEENLSGPEYDVVLSRGLKVKARDGVKLSVDIYRPAKNGDPLPGPFPAIITRSPYDTRSGKGPSSQTANGEFFARHGYLYAVQDVRGRFESEGDFVLLDGEGEDGYDVIEWLASLPYCDGNVGSQGSSLRAWNQNAAALERPPHLRAMWINQGGSNGVRTALRHNGAMELRWLSWALVNSIVSKEASRDLSIQKVLINNSVNLRQWLRKLPWKPGGSPLSPLPKWEKWALDLYTHGDYDEFWYNRSRNFERNRDETANIPTMYAGAWYDSYAQASIENFSAFQNTLNHQFLLMGPGIHGGPNFDRRISGEVDMGPEAPIKGNLAESRLHLMLRWFDRWLKSVENGCQNDPKVRYYTMGGGGGKNEEDQLLHGGHWQISESWPPPKAVETNYFLNNTGKLINSKASEESSGKTTFIFDPDDPLPTIAGNVSSLTENLVPPKRMMRTGDPIMLRRSVVLQGASDQVTHEDVFCNPPYGDIAERSDVLVFETDPLKNPVEVTGQPRVELFFSSDAPDTDIFCMLLDIYPLSASWPKGYRLNICDSLMRVRYRNGLDQPELMKAGEIVKVAFPLYPSSNLFDKGHRIRLLISSSSFPRFDVNPNTGEAIGCHTYTQVAQNTIHHSVDFPSCLILPIMQ
ncbi:MAG: CocE/NonD family hydrolase [SAR324 cluster bacterium]|nr:CocE/NonD family hydrolase [SAR324 cluster bacterium]